MKLRTFLVALMLCMTSMAYATNSPYNGWWYDSDHPGTGVSVEIHGNTAFVALFMYYDDSHKPMWLSAALSKTSGETYAGDLDYWMGWPLGSSYSEPTRHTIGNLALKFNGETADLTYTVTGFTSGGAHKKDRAGTTSTAHLVKFMKHIASGSLDPRDINGWWYDPSYNGMGFFLEVYGGTAFMAWYHYGSDGLPHWYTFDGYLEPGETVLNGTFREWSGGVSIGAENYQSPVSENIGTGTLTLTSSGATFETPYGTYNLQRFDFQ